MWWGSGRELIYRNHSFVNYVSHVVNHFSGFGRCISNQTPCSFKDATTDSAQFSKMRLLVLGMTHMFQRLWHLHRYQLGDWSIHRWRPSCSDVISLIGGATIERLRCQAS